MNASSRLPGLDGLSAADVAAALQMQPHREGGHFRETYRSPITIPTPRGPRSLCTAILYLLTAADPSRFHRLRFDEVWFYHAGAPAELVFLQPLETRVIGDRVPQVLVPGGRWMAARTVVRGGADSAQPVLPCADWTLVGCVVSPGFEYEDFEQGECEILAQEHPEAVEYIRALT